MRKQVELSITHNGKDVVTYPYTKKEHVQFENGMNIDEFVGQDIATPTITHDTTAIKVGVGDSDVSSSVVDSAVNMTIKGQTYQNILPEPTLRNEMQGKSMQRLNEGYDSIETVDGVSKSAILKGQTLVNLVPRKIIDHIASSDWDGYCCLVQNSKQSTDQWRTLQDLKPNTKYYISCYVETFEDANNKDYCLNNPSVESIFGDSMIFNGVGRYQWLSTTKSELTDEIFIALRSQNAHARGAIKIRDIMIIEYQEGMENWDIPYFEGMSSVKMPVLQTVGKNLFDKVSLGLGGNAYTNTVEYLPQLNNNTRATLSKGKLITVEPNSTITLSCDNRFKCVIQEYDENENRTKSGDKGWQNGGSHTLTVGEKTNKINIYFAKQDPHSSEGITDEELSLLKNSIQMETSSSKTTYEPYKTNILHTPEEVVLRSLPNGVKDTLNLNTGEYVQRIGETTLDGSSRNDLNYHAVMKEQDGQFCRMIINGCSFYNKSKYGNCDKLTFYHTEKTYVPVEGVFPFSGNDHLYIQISTSRISGADSMEGLSSELKTAFRDWLQANPITIQHELATPIIKTVDLSIVDQDDNTQENLNFFANGHIQVSSGENSLLPFVQYEIPTKNSYHMDLMKANTQYTIKSKSASGTFTIDGASYEAGTNGTFTTPTSMTNKLLVMSNKTNEEVMIIEGDVVSKTIPYFKGIKSAFEDENKIEVLSTSHNLWTGVDNYTNSGATIILKDENECIFEHHKVNDGIKVKVEDYEYQVITMSYDFEILDGEVLNVGGHNRHETKAFYIDGVKATEGYHNGHVATYQNNRVYHVDHVVHINLPMGQGNVVGEREYIGIEPNRYSADTPTYCKMRVTNFQITLGNTIKGYASPKSNSTKIPLLSPLRSLPNGICDELIIDRLNHKAKLIQRIGYEVLNENTAFSSYPTMEKEKTLLFQTQNANPQGASTYCISDQFIHRNNLWDSSDSDTEAIMIGGGEGNIGKRIDFRISKAKVSTNNVTILQDYLSKEPITVLYQLNIPIITEIDLEGYPYIYKDGHIFLNSDIAPTTQITYSINQAQQIESANENLQRHEKEISHLQKLIAQYIQVEYESTLLSLKI